MPISPPPRDDSGQVIPHDHDEIDGEDRIIRRISQEHVVAGATPGSLRLSRIAYQPSTGPNGGMSIDIEKLIIEEGHDPQKFVTTPPFTGSVVFKASAFRGEGLMVGYDPLPENPCHGEIWGNFTDARRKRLKRAATWFVEIPGVDLAK